MRASSTPSSMKTGPQVFGPGSELSFLRLTTILTSISSPSRRTTYVLRAFSSRASDSAAVGTAAAPIAVATMTAVKRLDTRARQAPGDMGGSPYAERLARARSGSDATLDPAGEPDKADYRYYAVP